MTSMHERIPLGIIDSAVYGLRDGTADRSSVYRPAFSVARLSVTLSK